MTNKNSKNVEKAFWKKKCRYTEDHVSYLLANYEGDLMLVTNPENYDGETKNPRVFYDGGKIVMFLPNPDLAIRITDITDEDRELLNKCEKILVHEVGSLTEERTYSVPVIRKLHIE